MDDRIALPWGLSVPIPKDDRPDSLDKLSIFDLIDAIATVVEVNPLPRYMYIQRTWMPWEIWPEYIEPPYTEYEGCFHRLLMKEKEDFCVARSR